MLRTDKATARALVRAVLEEEADMRLLALRELKWLTVKDVQTITGFGKDKVLSLHRKGKIPFFRAPDSNELRITRAAWTKCETRLVKEGLLPHNRYQHQK